MLDIIQSLVSKLYLEAEYYLSDVADLIREKCGREFVVKHTKIQSCIIDYFGENVCFVFSKQKNKSQRFYLIAAKKMTESVEHNCIIECANILKESLEQIDFGLEDKFCDANDLRLAWNDMNIPDAFSLFLFTLLDCTKNDVLKDNIDICNTDFTISEALKKVGIKTLFQIIYNAKK